MATLTRRVPALTGVRSLPSARAVVGGLLVTLAAVGAFTALRASTAVERLPYLVAARDLPAGTELTEADLAIAPADVPAGPAELLTTDPSTLVGHVLAADVSGGQLLGARAVVAIDAAPPAHEIALRLPPEAALGGGLELADAVVVVSTDAGCTTALAAATVQRLTSDESLSGGSTIVTLRVGNGADVLAVAHAAAQGEVTLVRSSDTAVASVCSAS